MSLIRATIRMCTVAALRNRTWAENRVYDSDNTPLLDALRDAQKPYITVFTDEDVTQEMYGRDIYTGDHRMSLVFEFGIASAAQVENKSGTLNIPQTDQALEALVDILERQIVAAAITDTYSPFGELLRQMINKIIRAPSMRGGTDDKTSTRWAARQLTLVCDTISEPAPGVVLEEDHPIRQFINLAKSDDFESLGMAQGAALLERVLEDTPAPDWRQGQAWLGLTRAGIVGTGTVPMPDGDEQGHLFVRPVPDQDDSIQLDIPLRPDDYEEPPEIPDSPDYVPPEE